MKGLGSHWRKEDFVFNQPITNQCSEVFDKERSKIFLKLIINIARYTVVKVIFFIVLTEDEEGRF